MYGGVIFCLSIFYRHNSLTWMVTWTVKLILVLLGPTLKFGQGGLIEVWRYYYDIQWFLSL